MISRLWYHETLRIYHDRLVCHEDRSYFYKLLQNVCTRFFDSAVIKFSASDINLTRPPILLFGDFMNPDSKENRIYEEIVNIEKLNTVLMNNLMDFNTVYNKDMQIIFFLDAIEHITRITRILRSERGNALLVGISGMGKQSLTKLASHINAYKYTFLLYIYNFEYVIFKYVFSWTCRCFQIELDKSYNYSIFHEDLVNLYYKAGAKFEDTTFLFTDSQIIQEEFLEDINNILSSGKLLNYIMLNYFDTKHFI